MTRPWLCSSWLVRDNDRSGTHSIVDILSPKRGRRRQGDGGGGGEKCQERKEKDSGKKSLMRGSDGMRERSLSRQ